MEREKERDRERERERERIRERKTVHVSSIKVPKHNTRHTENRDTDMKIQSMR